MRYLHCPLILVCLCALNVWHSLPSTPDSKTKLHLVDLDKLIEKNALPAHSELRRYAESFKQKQTNKIKNAPKIILKAEIKDRNKKIEYLEREIKSSRIALKLLESQGKDLESQIKYLEKEHKSDQAQKTEESATNPTEMRNIESIQSEIKSLKDKIQLFQRDTESLKSENRLLNRTINSIMQDYFFTIFGALGSAAGWLFGGILADLYGYQILQLSVFLVPISSLLLKYLSIDIVGKILLLLVQFALCLMSLSVNRYMSFLPWAALISTLNQNASILLRAVLLGLWLLLNFAPYRISTALKIMLSITLFPLVIDNYFLLVNLNWFGSLLLFIQNMFVSVGVISCTVIIANTYKESIAKCVSIVYITKFLSLPVLRLTIGRNQVAHHIVCMIALACCMLSFLLPQIKYKTIKTGDIIRMLTKAMQNSVINICILCSWLLIGIFMHMIRSIFIFHFSGPIANIVFAQRADKMLTLIPMALIIIMPKRLTINSTNCAQYLIFSMFAKIISLILILVGKLSVNIYLVKVGICINSLAFGFGNTAARSAILGSAISYSLVGIVIQQYQSIFYVIGQAIEKAIISVSIDILIAISILLSLMSIVIVYKKREHINRALMIE